MNSNPYTVPAIVLLAAMLLAVIAGLYWATARRDRQPAYQPGHTRRAVRARLRAEAAPFADPADVSDPEGGRFVEELHGDLGIPLPNQRRERAGYAPPPGWLDHFEPVHLETLARVRDALAALPCPASPVAVIMASEPREPQIDDTRPQPALIAWDYKTPAQVADELAARYLT